VPAAPAAHALAGSTATGGFGAGKSTTMRMMVGLDRPDAGHAAIGGRRYRDLRWPLREVGTMLEARAFHPGRTARAHRTALAASNSISPGLAAQGRWGPRCRTTW
jgi:ABC-type multidrug transport system ATPase subunit